jgi:hypothetical protein
MAQTVVAGEELDMETVECVLTDCEEEWTVSECGCCGGEDWIEDGKEDLREE